MWVLLLNNYCFIEVISDFMLEVIIYVYRFVNWLKDGFMFCFFWDGNIRFNKGFFFNNFLWFSFCIVS